MMNKDLEKTIEDLKTAKRKTGHKVWGAVAEELDKPKRIRTSVNLSRINRETDEDQIAVIPGKVLASGSLKHRVIVAAFAFSETAAEKIEAAGGSAKLLSQLVNENPDVSKIKLLK